MDKRGGKSGSVNQNKAHVCVAKVYERAVNARHDFQHKRSKRLIDKNQTIDVETLPEKNMLQYRHLARSIREAA